MLKGSLKTILFALLLAVLVAQSVEAKDCGVKYTVYDTNYCSYRAYFPWSADGADWQTWIQHTNTTSQNVGFNTTFIDQQGDVEQINARNVIVWSYAPSMDGNENVTLLPGNT